MDDVRTCIVAALLSTACRGGVVPGAQPMDEATGSSTSATTEGSSTDHADSTTNVFDTSSSSSGSSGETDDEPTPLPTSRLVLDVATPGGHALMLRELVDGIPQPAAALTGDVPASADITITRLGTSDRIAMDVRFDDTTHDLFLVDWTSGHPAVVTQFDDAVIPNSSIGPMVWVEELSAIVVRIGYTYYRIDVTDDGPAEPIDLLEELPFVVELNELQRDFVAPYGPFLVAEADQDLWVADLADPSAPAVNVSGLEVSPFAIRYVQLAGGHLVYQATHWNYEEPSEVHVVLRSDDGWSAPLVITPPVEFPTHTNLNLVRPGTDEFTYWAIGESSMQLRLGGIDGDALAAPIVLREGATTGHEFSPDGMHLAYRVDDDQSLEIITFTEEGPSRPRTLDAPRESTAQLLLPRLVSGDGWVYFNVCQDTLSHVKAILRVGLEPGAASQVLAGELGAEERIRQDVFDPDQRWLAFARTGVRGLTTSIVDLTGAQPGAPVEADRGDAPILEDLIASPDGNWLAASRSHGGAPDSVTVVRSDDPAQAVLEDVDLVSEAVWLP